MDISAREVIHSKTAFAVGLVNKIQTGDKRAEAEFVKAYSDKLMSMLLCITHDPDIAKDCLQETLMIALRKIRAGDIRKPESILAFLHRTAANTVTSHHRTENRYTNLGDRVLQLPGEMEDVASMEKDTEIINCLLKELLSNLSVPRDSEILRRFYLNEEDKKSIYRDFRIRPEHFDRVICRAKQRVRLLLNSQRSIRAVLQSFLGKTTAGNGKPVRH